MIPRGMLARYAVEAQQPRTLEHAEPVLLTIEGWPDCPINPGDILTVEGWKRPDGTLIQFRAVVPEGRALHVEPLHPGDTFSMDIRPRINPQE